MKLGAVILCGGYSSRMIDFKPLLEIGGVAALHRCTRLFRECGLDQIIVVTGHRADEVEGVLRQEEVRCCFNPGYDDGMYSSIRTGVNALTDVDGFFLLPVDIPLVRPATVETLKAEFSGQLLYPDFGGRRGHPPLIPAAHIPEILNYGGEGGLKRLLGSFSSKNVRVWDRAILTDMDTRNDFSSLTHHYTSMQKGTREEALALAGLTLPERGLRHGLAVAEIAEQLGIALNRCGQDYDLDILYNSGLLHDIEKGHPDHEHAGAVRLKKLGLSSLAECVYHHRDGVPPEDGILGEAELVLLADKLVKGCHPVSVRERFENKLDLYAGDEAACRAIRRRMENALSICRLVEQQCGKPVEEIIGRAR